MREKIVKTLETEQGLSIEISISYDKGGMNYFTGVKEKRGYYLSVTPCRVENGSKIYRAFSGVKTHLLYTPRFSKKKMDELCTSLDKEVYERYLDIVLRRNNLKLKEA